MAQLDMTKFMIGRQLAGKKTPKKARNRAGVLAALSGDMIGAMNAGKRIKAEEALRVSKKRLTALEEERAGLDKGGDDPEEEDPGQPAHHRLAAAAGPPPDSLELWERAINTGADFTRAVESFGESYLEVQTDLASRLTGVQEAEAHATELAVKNADLNDALEEARQKVAVLQADRETLKEWWGEDFFTKKGALRTQDAAERKIQAAIAARG